MWSPHPAAVACLLTPSERGSDARINGKKTGIRACSEKEQDDDDGDEEDRQGYIGGSGRKNSLPQLHTSNKLFQELSDGSTYFQHDSAAAPPPPLSAARGSFAPGAKLQLFA